MLDTNGRVRLEFPGPVGRERHRRLRAAVITIAQADDIGVAGKLAR